MRGIITPRRAGSSAVQKGQTQAQCGTGSSGWILGAVGDVSDLLRMHRIPPPLAFFFSRCWLALNVEAKRSKVAAHCRRESCCRGEKSARTFTQRSGLTRILARECAAAAAAARVRYSCRLGARPAPALVRSYVEKEDSPNKDPKQEEDDESAILVHDSSIMKTSRGNRGRRNNARYSTPSRRRDAENSRKSRSRTGSLQLVCKSEPEPETEQLEYEITEVHPSVIGISSDEEELLISEEEIPFKDDPRDETYKPHLEREPLKARRKSGKEEKEKQKEIKVEVKEENEFREEDDPPRKRGRRRKDDKTPRVPKRRKKPPIQYVRCEMEGCGTVLAHPRYLQHHIKYQHLLKKKYVCPHPSCGRLFRLQKQLLRHAKHHTDQRDYICEYCARAFKSSHNLAVHRMIHTGEKPLQCEICGFTCRQKASLNWHMKKHDADSFYQFSCNICGKKFEKKDSVVAHKAKSHPEVLIAEALAANAGALITNTNILGSTPEVLAPPLDAQGLPLLPEPLGGEAYCSGLATDAKILVGCGSSAGMEGLVLSSEALGATTEVLIEDSDSTGP
ncbi:E3 ubiquitin-protein ligase ZFP91 isoform X3 [Rhinatrema bivittatum]|uniref:E3 ubiquitin-protein ligase ZFP91 isoform X3 n=1 Tax=Rhinatrema bivittatum TaxID=194408 RepID=UPI0011272DD7|nr:E3 ubiquitin-protein ligase ZFP91 isoform X3 [Rhinatrema bivittatum]